MHNILNTNPEPLRVAVKSGLPDTTHAPLTADLIALIQEQAEARGPRLERYELHPEVPTDWHLVSAWWVVSDLPSALCFESLREAHGMLSEQISTRLPGIWDDTQDCEPVLHDLGWLLRLVTEGNERDGIASTETLHAIESAKMPQRFEFPLSPQPCSVILASALPLRRWSSVAEESVNRTQAVAQRLGCDVMRLEVRLRTTDEGQASGAFWVLAPRNTSVILCDTDQVRTWLSGVLHAECPSSAHDAATIAALESLQMMAERRLAEIQG